MSIETAKFDINYLHNGDYTSLYMAVEDGSYQKAEELLLAGADPNIKTSSGVYPLTMAVQENNLQMVNLLLKYEANVNVANSRGYSPLFLAVYLGFADIAKSLLENNADVNYISPENKNLFQLAKEKNNIEIFSLLKEKYQSKCSANLKGINEIAYVVSVKDQEDVIFENLVWHYTLGFRKFVVMDSSSNYNTSLQVKKFSNLVNNKTQIYTINYSSTDFNKGKIIDGAINFAKNIWSDVKWIFPAEAQDFWIFRKSLNYILAEIDSNIDFLKIFTNEYKPATDYCNFSDSVKFYNKFHYLDFSFSGEKIIVKANNNNAKSEGESLTIARGNDLGIELYQISQKPIDCQSGSNDYLNVNFAIDDPLPLGRVMENFYQITNN